MYTQIRKENKPPSEPEYEVVRSPADGTSVPMVNNPAYSEAGGTNVSTINNPAYLACTTHAKLEADHNKLQ